MKDRHIVQGMVSALRIRGNLIILAPPFVIGENARGLAFDTMMHTSGD
jgi:hypothetical protein